MSRKVRPRSVRRATPELRRADQARIAAGREVRYRSPVMHHDSSGANGGRASRTTVLARAGARPAPGSANLAGTSWVMSLMERFKASARGGAWNS